MLCHPLLKLFFFALFSFSLLFAQDPEQQMEQDLIINLQTENCLLPTYFSPFLSEKTELTNSYVKQLEKVLTFDLAHNGSMLFIAQTTENNQLANQSSLFDSLQQWQAQNIFFVIKGLVEQNSLTLTVLDVKSKTVKKIGPLTLTGNLSNDRRQIHRAADLIHQASFGSSGIASTKILYSVLTKNGADSTKWVSEIWEADYDGENRQQLTHERSYSISPVYIPPKPGFVTGGFMYVSYQLSQPKIYIRSFQEKTGHRLTTLKGNQLMPAISLKRDQVAFISDVVGNPDLFILPFDPEKGATAKPHQIFSARKATQGSPTFSPDGKQIAFVSNKSGSPKIYLIDIPKAGASLKNIEARLISKRNRENSAPAWSPDGKKIAYCARHGAERQIWIYDFETDQEEQLTSGPGHKENPSWAPNSLHLIYNSSTNEESELYFIHLKQKKMTKLFTGKGDKRFPNWEVRF